MVGPYDLRDVAGRVHVEQQQAQRQDALEAARLQERGARGVGGRLDDDAAAPLLACGRSDPVEQPRPDAAAPVGGMDVDAELAEVRPAGPVEQAEPRSRNAGPA